MISFIQHFRQPSGWGVYMDSVWIVYVVRACVSMSVFDAKYTGDGRLFHY